MIRIADVPGLHAGENRHAARVHEGRPDSQREAELWPTCARGMKRTLRDADSSYLLGGAA